MSALDTHTRAGVRAELRRTLDHLDLPVLLVTHDFQDAAVLADRVGVLVDGRLLQVGSPGELIAAPADAFVASFTGANILVGVARRAEGGLTEVTLEDGSTLFSVDEAEGPASVAVYPWEISIAREAPDDSSLNHVRRPITSLVRIGNRARVQVGPLVGEVTTASVERLGLHEGETVVASFKAAATHLVARNAGPLNGPQPARSSCFSARSAAARRPSSSRSAASSSRFRPATSRSAAATASRASRSRSSASRRRFRLASSRAGLAAGLRAPAFTGGSPAKPKPVACSSFSSRPARTRSATASSTTAAWSVSRTRSSTASLGGCPASSSRPRAASASCLDRRALVVASALQRSGDRLQAASACALRSRSPAVSRPRRRIFSPPRQLVDCPGGDGRLP